MPSTLENNATRTMTGVAESWVQDLLPEVLKPPYRLIFLLPLLGAQWRVGPWFIVLYYFAIPVAAWLGYRYRRAGFITIAVGTLPLLYGSPSFAGFSLILKSDLYIVLLVVSLAFAYPEQWWQRLKAVNITNSGFLALFILGGAMVLFKGTWGMLGWAGSAVLLYFSAFVIGLTERGFRQAFVYAVILGAIGMGFSYFGLACNSLERSLLFSGSPAI